MVIFVFKINQIGMGEKKTMEKELTIKVKTPRKTRKNRDSPTPPRTVFQGKIPCCFSIDSTTTVL